MKQREFDALWRAEAIRFSGGQFRLAVETLDSACRDAAQGEEPVEDQRLVSPQAPGDFLHRGDRVGFAVPGDMRVQEQGLPWQPACAAGAEAEAAHAAANPAGVR